MLKLRNHKQQTIEINSNYNFTSIEELSDQIINNALNIYETAYSKKSMTNGNVPFIHLLKAIIRLHRNLNSESYHTTDANYLDSFKYDLVNFEEIEELETRND